MMMMMMWAQLMLLPGPSNISLNAGWMLVILSEFSNRCLAPRALEAQLDGKQQVAELRPGDPGT